MRRLFTILATLAGSLLVASLVSGMLGGSRLHARIGWLATATTLAAHASAFTYFWASERWVEATARAGDLPDWVRAQAEKNRRKASAYQTWGVVLVVLAAESGRISANRGWHLAWSASALGFELGAFVGESVVIVAHERFLKDVEG